MDRTAKGRLAQLGYKTIPDTIDFDPCEGCKLKRRGCYTLPCKAWQLWFAYRWRNAVTMIRGDGE